MEDFNIISIGVEEIKTHEQKVKKTENKNTQKWQK